MVKTDKYLAPTHGNFIPNGQPTPATPPTMKVLRRTSNSGTTSSGWVYFDDVSYKGAQMRYNGYDSPKDLGIAGMPLVDLIGVEWIKVRDAEWILSPYSISNTYSYSSSVIFNVVSP